MKRVIKTYVGQLPKASQDNIRKQLESYGLTPEEVEDAMNSKISDITGNPECPIDIEANAEIDPPPHWIHWTDDYKDYATCSNCEYGLEGELLLKDTTPYCPWCGSHMLVYGLDIVR